MKQTVMWLALALVFAIGATSRSSRLIRPAATAGRQGQQPGGGARPVVAASAKPAEPEVPVAMLDDVPLSARPAFDLKRLLAGSSHPAHR